jgi:choline dehydrogenase-like flavoprotein
MGIQVFDVCVIGSGPAGGVLAKELAESGAKVVLMEAGRLMTPRDFHYHAWPYDLPNHVVGQGPQPSAAYPPDLIKAIRYEDCDQIGVDRIRAVGGRSIHWNAVSLRFAERDFREQSIDGVEEDWPLSYQELAPDYSHVEKTIGVTGSRENLEIVPDGEFLPPLRLRCSEEIIKRVCGRMGIRVIPTRKALLTVEYDNRPPCHYCGHCMEGCDVGAIFSVPDSMLPKAEKTGNFALVQNKLARELLVDREGLVRSASVIDTVSRKEEEIRARIFVVCCGAPESARLLLNSRSPQFPNGLANSQDMVGRYLHGSVAADLIACLEELAGTPPVNNDGALDHAYIPRFNHLDGKKREYVGGFHYQLNYRGYMFPFQAQYLKGFGEPFKKQVRELQPGFVHFGAWGKVLAEPQNRVTVDPHQLDAFGIPVPVLHFRFGDNDRALWKDMAQKAHEILETAKAKVIVNTTSEPVGFGSHEAGTVRMGKDPRTSVLNSYCQAHDVKNLFVVGGSSFTTYPEKNPTLTIMALAVRTARYITREVRNGNLSGG